MTIASIASLAVHKVNLNHVPDRPTGAIPIVGLSPLAIETVGALDMVSSLGTVVVGQEGKGFLKGGASKGFEDTPQARQPLVGLLLDYPIPLFDSPLPGIRKEGKDFIHKPSDGIEPKVSLGQVLENPVLLWRQVLPPGGEDVSVLPQEATSRTVFWLLSQLSPVNRHRIQDSLSEGADEVKKAHLVLGIGPYLKGDSPVEGRAIANYHFWLYAQALEVLEEGPQLLAGGGFTKPNGDRSIVQGIGGYKDHELIVKLIYCQDTREALSRPGFILLKQVNLVCVAMEPLPEGGLGWLDIEIPLKTASSPTEGCLILSNGSQSPLNSPTAVMLALDRTWGLDTEELDATRLIQTPIHPHGHCNDPLAVKADVLDPAGSYGVALAGRATLRTLSSLVWLGLTINTFLVYTGRRQRLTPLS